MVEIVNCVAEQIFIFTIVVLELDFRFQLIDKLTYKCVVDKNVIRSGAGLTKVVETSKRQFRSSIC